MITNVKTQLEQSGIFKSVSLAEALQPITDFAESAPAAIIYQNRTEFTGSITDNIIYQPVSKYVTVIVLCLATEVETIENRTLNAMVGFQPAPEYSEFQAVSIDNHDIKGNFYSRNFLFKTMYHIREV